MKLLIITLTITILSLSLVIIYMNSKIKYMKIESWSKEKPKINLSLLEAKEIILESLNTAYSRINGHPTVNTVKLKDENIRSAIIGSSGRNLRLIEKLTNTDIKFDNSNSFVTISCFNPLKREVATNLLNDLINTKTINASVIEKKMDDNIQKMDNIIFAKGKEAFAELNIDETNEDIIYNIGKLYFRYSYGQNVLSHSIETAKIMATIARKFDLNIALAKRAGLFHDIGKAFDIEKEGSHVDLGVEYAKIMKEPAEVIDAIHCHHGDKVSSTIISAFVAFADKLSAARPGARKHTTEKLFSRVKQMEALAKLHEDVKEAYVINGGKEIRVLIKAKAESSISDIAKSIKYEFEYQLKFPGVINIVAIKENRYSTKAIQNKTK